MTFYRDIDPVLCQGDLLDEIPSIHLHLPIGALKKIELKGKRQAWNIVPTPPESVTAATHGVNFKIGEQCPAFCQITRAILLSHGCDIDNDQDHRLVALVRPIAAVLPQHREVVQANRNSNYFYLPHDNGRGLVASYVDFRRITCLHPGALEGKARLASLSDEAVRALQGQWFRFVTRREITLPAAAPVE